MNQDLLGLIIGTGVIVAMYLGVVLMFLGESDVTGFWRIFWWTGMPLVILYIVMSVIFLTRPLSPGWLTFGKIAIPADVIVWMTFATLNYGKW